MCFVFKEVLVNVVRKRPKVAILNSHFFNFMTFRFCLTISAQEVGRIVKLILAEVALAVIMPMFTPTNIKITAVMLTFA